MIWAELRGVRIERSHEFRDLDGFIRATFRYEYWGHRSITPNDCRQAFRRGTKSSEAEFIQ
jgi:hypothetical protein